MNSRERSRTQYLGGMGWVLFALALLLTLAPSLYALLLSLKDYHMLRGLANSPWAGMKLYDQFFQSAYAWPVMRNSAWLSLLGLLGALLLGMPLGWLVTRIKGDGGRHVAIASLLLPAFVPALCYAAAALTWLPKDWLATPQQYPLGYLCMVALPGAGIVAFAAALYAEYTPGRGFARGIGWVLLAAAFLCLTPHLETVHLTMSPATYQASDILDTYAYRQGLGQMAYSNAGAVHMVKAVLQCVLGAALVCLGVGLGRVLRRDTDGLTRAATGRTIPWPAYFIPLAALWGLGAYLLWQMPAVMGEGDMWPATAQVMGTLGTAAVALLIIWAFSALLAGGLKRMGWLGTCLCMAVLLAFRNATVGEYFIARVLGVINTVLPGFVHAALSPITLVLVLLISRAGNAHGDVSMAKAALLPACFATSLVWGGTFGAMLFTTDASKFTLGLWARTASVGGPQMLVLLLIPCVLLGVLGTWGALAAFSKR